MAKFILEIPNPAIEADGAEGCRPGKITDLITNALEGAGEAWHSPGEFGYYILKRANVIDVVTDEDWDSLRKKRLETS